MKSDELVTRNTLSFDEGGYSTINMHRAGAVIEHRCARLRVDDGSAYLDLSVGSHWLDAVLYATFVAHELRLPVSFNFNRKQDDTEMTVVRPDDEGAEFTDAEKAVFRWRFDTIQGADYLPMDARMVIAGIAKAHIQARDQQS